MIPVWFALSGLFFAIWLAAFFHDSKRPISPQERADRLAAQNFLELSIASPTPPSPAHWAQMRIWQDPSNGERHPASRDASALVLACSGMHPRVAGVVAFTLAATALGWLLCDFASLSALARAIFGVSGLLAVAHGRDWQMGDPTPYLILAASSLSFAAWLRYRRSISSRAGWILGFGIASLFLCAPALGFLILGLIILDLLKTCSSECSVRGLILLRTLSGCGLILLVLLIALLARNQVATDNPFISPTRAYDRDYVSAPHWLWELIRKPPVHLDPIIERYDELVALPAARWANPVYRIWLGRLSECVQYAAGIGLGLLALASALALPSRDTRPALLLGIGTTALACLYYPLSSTWWPFASPAFVGLAALGYGRIHDVKPMLAYKVLTVVLIFQIASLPSAPKARPEEQEYQLLQKINEVKNKIIEKPGRHLAFVQVDSSVDARVELSNLPRDWSQLSLLLARDLTQDENAALVAALPDYTPWTIFVFRDRVGLRPWAAPAPTITK